MASLSDYKRYKLIDLRDNVVIRDKFKADFPNYELNDLINKLGKHYYIKSAMDFDLQVLSQVISLDPSQKGKTLTKVKQEARADYELKKILKSSIDLCSKVPNMHPAFDGLLSRSEYEAIRNEIATVRGELNEIESGRRSANIEYQRKIAEIRIQSESKARELSKLAQVMLLDSTYFTTSERGSVADIMDDQGIDVSKAEQLVLHQRQRNLVSAIKEGKEVDIFEGKN